MLVRESCPITGSTNLVRKVDIPFSVGVIAEWVRPRGRARQLEGLNYTVYFNPEVDFYFQRIVFSEQEEEIRRRQLASTNSSSAERVATLNDLCHKAEDAILIRLLFRNKGRPRVLDFGMGGGEWALLAKAFGAEVWGTDIDPRSQIAANSFGIQFSNPVDLPDNFFDFINGDQVFEHLVDPLKWISCLVRKLVPGGHLKLSTPHDNRIENKFRRLAEGEYTEVKHFSEDFRALIPLHHINLFSRTSLIALARRAGLVHYQIPLPLSYAAIVGFHSLRQLNRNAYNPLKRHLARKTWQYFVKR